MLGKLKTYFSRTVGWRVTAASHGRATPPPERRAEDQILTPHKRLKLISSARDTFRNTTFSPATAQQLKINVIGSLGGKLTLTTDDDTWNAQAGKWFGRWARRAEFTNALHLNELLQLGLVQLSHNGGDFVLVFDDGVLTGGNGSGRIRMFESDEIANIKADIFKVRYGGRGWKQSNGLIYDMFGRHVGCFVSASQRGRIEFEEGNYLTLLRDPIDPPEASPWLYVGQFWRPNQGRGIPTAAHIVGALDEMNEAATAELSAAKLNAHIALKVTEREADAIPDSDDIERGIAALQEDAGDGEQEGDAQPGQTAGQPPASDQDEGLVFDTLQSGLAGVWQAPPGKDLASFDTHRPNLNLMKFIENAKGDATTVFGLGLLYATLNPQQSYTAFRGAMLMAWGTFEQMQKKFERSVLDWIAVVALRWAADMGAISDPPEDFDAALAWSWPTMKEVNETDAQTALEKKYTNSETNLMQRHGADWRRHVDQAALEIEYCNGKGLIHPSQRTAGGGGIADGSAISRGTDTDVEKENTDDE